MAPPRGRTPAIPAARARRPPGGGNVSNEASARREGVAVISGATGSTGPHELEELRAKLAESATRIDELESRNKELEQRSERHNDELDGWHERYNRAREQSDHAKRLLEETREELQDRTDEIEGLEKRVAELESEADAEEATRSESTELIAELKTRVVQKDRRIDELQRELDLMEYDLRQKRDLIEELESKHNDGNSEARKLDRECELLREVISEKENHVSELKSEIEEQSREIYDLKLGTGVKDLEEAKRDVLEKYFEKNREVDELREKARVLQRRSEEYQAEIEALEERINDNRDIASHPDFERKQREVDRAVADLAQAQEDVERVQAKLEQFGPEAKAKIEAQLNFLERKNRALQEKLDKLSGAADGGLSMAEREEMEAQLRASTREARETQTKLEAAEAKLRELEAGAPAPGETGQISEAKLLRASAAAHLEEVEDAFAMFAQDTKLLETYVDEAKGEAKGTAAAEAVEALTDLLNVVKGDADDVKDALNQLKRLVKD